jgi:molecular chaperone GrpE
MAAACCDEDCTMAEEEPKPTDADEPTEFPENGSEAGDAEVTTEDLEEARRECAELMERLQRTAADYQNFQKRVAKRIDEAVAFAVRDLVLDLLPVIDNFERALEAARTDADPQAFRDGVQLVHDQLIGALARHGIERIDAEGEPFDPEHHEAVSHVPVQDVPPNHVAEVLQTGYRLGERTIRPSRVVVAAPPPEAEEEES